MARAGCKPNGLQKLEGDDVEKSLELLDKVLSEFEDPDSLPHIEPESPSQGNQSEDDGYMSMNGRRAKIPPDFHHHQQQQQEQHQQQLQQQGQQHDQQPYQQSGSDESSTISPPVMEPLPVLPSETEETKSEPPPPEVAEAIISNLLPRSGSTTIITTLDPNQRINNPRHHLVRQQSQDICDYNNSSSSVPVVINTYINGDDRGDETKANGTESSNCNNGRNGDADGTAQQQFNEKRNVNIAETQIPSQTTLPKTRPATVIPSRYSSLPCSGPARSFDGTSSHGIGGIRCGAMGSGSFDGGGGGRNILGIGISAVHDAVLRGGVAKLLPEPIVNEHPVTIYPGRASPPRGRVPPRTLPGSVERHREVCRNLLNPNDLDPNNLTIIEQSCARKMYSPSHQQFIISKSPSSPVMMMVQRSSPSKCGSSNLLSHSSSSNNNSSCNSINSFSSTNQMFDNKMIFGNFEIPPRKRTENGTDGVRKANDQKRCSDSSEENFSDDSLEGQSLPPPPPPPIVPPPPSLSAPVTPSKRGSIAWEINLDDHLPPPPPAHIQNHISAAAAAAATASSKSRKKNSGNKDKSKSATKLDNTSSSSSAKVIPRRRGRSVSGGSQSSLASTPGNSGGSLSNNHSPKHHNLRHRSGSVEWPELPNPPVCSTEDEAASLYSDSDDVIPPYPNNMTGQGTYVIRKGRRERNRLPELNASISSSINSRLSSEANSPGVTQLNNLFVPNSRHSIDLGASSQMPMGHSAMLSPRSRLSLDLSSPNSTSELPQSVQASVSSSMLGQQLQQHRYNDYKAYNNSNSSNSSSHFQQKQLPQLHHDDIHSVGSGNIESNGNGVVQIVSTHHGSSGSLNLNNNSSIGCNGLTRAGSHPSIGQQQQQQQQQNQSSTQNDTITTPRRELAPPLEEDEEQDSESQRGAPLRQIENNISALLRGDISVARVGDISHARRPLAFRPGVHKSESAKEMLLSQATVFGPLPPSPPISSPEAETDGFPPLPPSPLENAADDEEDPDEDIVHGMHGIRITSRTRLHFSRENAEHPPAVPPHRQPSINTLKTRSMDAGYTKKYSTNASSHSGGPGTLPSDMPPNSSSRRRLMSGAYPKRSAHSPREERRLQTSCSLPETPIFARGCDIPRTPHRRAPELPASGSRTAPRTNPPTAPGLNSSIIRIGNTLGGGRQHNINHALASGEMLRLAGGPARGWYPKQRTNQRPASTEHLDRLHRTQGSMRAWDSGGMSGTGGNRKPLTLPPNLTPKFFNKSPREALRRVTSLLIRKGNGGKEKDAKRDKEAYSTSAVHRSPGSAGDIPVGQNGTVPANNSNHHHKKKGFFKSFWKKSKHYSLEQ